MQITDTASAATVLAGVLIVVGVVGVVLPGMPGLVVVWAGVLVWAILSDAGAAKWMILGLATFLTLLGIGFLNNMFALAVLATGPILTNAFDGVDGVDRDATDAARGMGMTGFQILRRIELPLAIPLLFTGIRVAAVTIVATAPIAAIAGGGGLGDIIVNQASYRLEGVLGASLCVMALSALVFLGLAGLQFAVTPRGPRRTSVGAVPTRKELL